MSKLSDWVRHCHDLEQRLETAEARVSVLGTALRAAIMTIDHDTAYLSLDAPQARVNLVRELRQASLPDGHISGTPGGLMVDELARAVTVAGKPVSLTPTEWGLFILLWRRRGEVVTKEEILKVVWGPEYGVEEVYIRVFIRQLRRKLGDDAQDPHYILTHQGVGYMMTT